MSTEAYDWSKRITIKVLPEYHAEIIEHTSNRRFPIKSILQLITIASMDWIRKFDQADLETKKRMVEDAKKLRQEAIEKKYLHKPREIKDDVIE